MATAHPTGGNLAIYQHKLSEQPLMTRQRAAQAVAIWWAVTGVAVAALTYGNVNDDARWLVAGAHLVGLAFAAASAWLLRRTAARAAGALLIVSALITPTYFAWPLNLFALLVGVALLVSPATFTGTREAKAFDRSGMRHEGGAA